MAGDYIPNNDAEFNQWYRFLREYVIGKTAGTEPEWKHIPQEAVAELDNANSLWNAAYEKAFGPHTPIPP
jgi:hypothetical protein